MILALSYCLGWIYGRPDYFVIGGAILAAAAVIFAWFSGGDMVLNFSRAQEAVPEAHQRVINVVDEMRIAAGVPMPKVFIINSLAMNAFATGIAPEKSAVVVTTGLAEKLTREELQGVIAHEMSHIRNYDIRYALLVAVVVGLIALLADGLRRSFWLGGGIGRRRGRGSGGGGIILLPILLLAILAPVFAYLLQMAVSRQREYLADSSAVELTRNPLGLASALKKISGDSEKLTTANRATQHLYFVNPLKSFSEKSTALMSTHPPTEERIRRLEGMAGAF